LRLEGNFSLKILWKSKISLEVKIILWLGLKKSILTKDNLLRWDELETHIALHLKWIGGSNLLLIEHVFVSQKNIYFASCLSDIKWN
jgi:hypothetical protein